MSYTNEEFNSKNTPNIPNLENREFSHLEEEIIANLAFDTPTIENNGDNTMVSKLNNPGLQVLFRDSHEVMYDLGKLIRSKSTRLPKEIEIRISTMIPFDNPLREPKNSLKDRLHALKEPFREPKPLNIDRYFNMLTTYVDLRPIRKEMTKYVLLEWFIHLYMTISQLKNNNRTIGKVAINTNELMAAYLKKVFPDTTLRPYEDHSPYIILTDESGDRILELQFYEVFLPTELTDQEIDNLGEQSLKELGKVAKILIEKYPNQPEKALQTAKDLALECKELLR